MSYAPTTDFLGLLRLTSGGVRFVRMPGLDYLIAALARAQLFQLWVSQVAPTTNQSTTVWLQPALPSSALAEGSVFLFNSATNSYAPATPALWAQFIVSTASGGYVFQSVNSATRAVNQATSLLAIQRTAPVATTLTLPAVATRARKALQIVDWSTAVAGHTITISPAAGETIMQLGAWTLLSTADQLAGITLYPSTDLSGWVIAP